MLKSYDSRDAVPEGLREHYKQVGDRWVPDISDDHPVKLESVKLLNDKTAAETKAVALEADNKKLNSDLESAKTHSLPRGHRAVPAVEVEAMEKLKEHGTAAEIVTKLTEHKTLSEKVAKQETDARNREVAKALGYENVDAFVMLPNLPDFENKPTNGKDNWVAKIKEGENVVEKPAQEHIEASYAPFMASLKAKGGVSVPEQRRGNEGAGDIYARLREQTKSEQANSAGINTVSERFGFAKVAA